jgi:hypothetical protein
LRIAGCTRRNDTTHRSLAARAVTGAAANASARFVLGNGQKYGKHSIGVKRLATEEEKQRSLHRR